MKLTRIHVLILLVSTLLLASGASTGSPFRILPPSLSEPDSATRARLEESFGKLPLCFVENERQVDGGPPTMSRAATRRSTSSRLVSPLP